MYRASLVRTKSCQRQGQLEPVPVVLGLEVGSDVRPHGDDLRRVDAHVGHVVVPLDVRHVGGGAERRHLVQLLQVVPHVRVVNDAADVAL